MLLPSQSEITLNDKPVSQVFMWHDMNSVSVRILHWKYDQSRIIERQCFRSGNFVMTSQDRAEITLAGCGKSTIRVCSNLKPTPGQQINGGVESCFDHIQ